MKILVINLCGAPHKLITKIFIGILSRFHNPSHGTSQRDVAQWSFSRDVAVAFVPAVGDDRVFGQPASWCVPLAAAYLARR
jgi:hypothetical protein